MKELNRLLRPNGYFVYSAPPAYKRDKDFPVIWEKVMNITTAMCWRLIARKIQTAIWIKENNSSCLQHNAEKKLLSICDDVDDSKPSWNIPLRNCVQDRNSERDSFKLPPQPKRLSVFSESLSKIGRPIFILMGPRSFFKLPINFHISHLLSSNIMLFWPSIVPLLEIS